MGESADLIQSKIDVALDGDVINVAESIYIGRLDLSAKKVTLQAESPDTLLIFTFEDFSFEGPSISLGQNSSLIGFTIASHRINVEDTGGRLLKNHFGIAEHYLGGGSINSSGNFRFDQNIITAKGMERIFTHATTEYSMGCVSITLENKPNTATTSVISNTLYKGNKLFHTNVSFPCDFVSFYGGTLHMTNNTFVGMGEPLIIVPSYQYNVADYQLFYSNNIGAGSRRLINNGIVTVHFDFGYTLSSRVENNLSYNMFLNIWDPEALLNETGTILSNPLLNSDYSLPSNSPAIDAGINNGVLIDLLDQARPVDGNGDGHIQHDIGAFEFRAVN